MLIETFYPAVLSLNHFCKYKENAIAPAVVNKINLIKPVRKIWLSNGLAPLTTGILPVPAGYAAIWGSTAAGRRFNSLRQHIQHRAKSGRPQRTSVLSSIRNSAVSKPNHHQRARRHACIDITTPELN